MKRAMTLLVAATLALVPTYSLAEDLAELSGAGSTLQEELPSGEGETYDQLLGGTPAVPADQMGDETPGTEALPDAKVLPEDVTRDSALDDSDQEDDSLEPMASVVASGYCGESDWDDAQQASDIGTNIKWTLTSDGTLTFVGSGQMGDWAVVDSPVLSTAWPAWHPYVDQVKRAVVGEGIVNVGPGALANMDNLTQVSLPASLRSIDENAFYQSSSLASIALNDGLESIGKNAFRYTAISSLDVPPSVGRLDFSVIEYLGVSNITLRGPNPRLTWYDGVLMGNGGTTVEYCPRDRQGTFVIPDGVKTIGQGAFADCEDLTCVVMPDGLESIEESAFMNAGLTEVDIPDSVTFIGWNAFYTMRFGDADTPVRIRIGSGLGESHGSYLFAGITGLREVEIPEGVKRLGMAAFLDCVSLTSIEFPSTCTVIDEMCCRGCTSLTSVTIPEGVTTIEKGAFSKTALTEVNLPSTISSIGEDAFPNGCKVNFGGPLWETDKGTYVGPGDATVFVTTMTYGQTEARKMLQMVNSFRADTTNNWYWSKDDTTKVRPGSLAGLAYDYDLEAAAMKRAKEIALMYSHYRPDHTGARLSAIPAHFSAKGENIAYGYASASAAMEAWKETDEKYDGQGHRRNMLSGDYNAIGIGHVVYNGTHYWVQELGYSDSLNTTSVPADDGTHDLETTVPNWRISPDTIVACDPGRIWLAKPGEGAAAPTAKGSGIRLAEWYPPERYGYGWHTLDVKAATEGLWRSDDPSIAEVSGGRVVAKSLGSTVLRTMVFGQAVEVPVDVYPFSDVNAATPHVQDICWLAESGITKGYSDGTYRGMWPVYRQDMAAFLHRMRDQVL